ncbi:MAG: PAS domain S-box protein [Chloroflexi bacterium]|nr:PAS domain S-box protein [Chloroflexota bacterium]MCL5273525.1 PAS domain S-box protein [Chloroflexota bacterium]
MTQERATEAPIMAQGQAADSSLQNWRYHMQRFAAAAHIPLDRLFGAGFFDAIEYAAIGVVLVDLEGRCLAANRAMCDMLGRATAEVAGMHFNAFTHPDDLTVNLDLGRQLIAGEIPSFQLEKRYIHKTGRTIWVLLSASLMRDESGAPLCVLSQIQDISERKRAEEALRDSEERYRAIVEDQNELVCRFLPDTTLTFVNAAYCRYFGKTREELIGQSLLQHVPPEIHADLREQFDILAQTAGTPMNEHPTLAADGARRWLEWTNRAITDRQGRVVEFQAVGRDISRRKLAQAAEREQRALAEALRDTAAALSSTLNYEQVLERILENAYRVVSHDAANIMLLDESTNEVYIAGLRGYARYGQEEWLRNLRLPLSIYTSIQRMLESGQPLVVPDVTTYAEWFSLPGSEWLRSYAAAPIRIKGKTIGLLNFDSGTRGFFNESHIGRLQAFADQAALAIENARLFEASHHNEEHLTRLHQVGIALAKADSIETLYREALRGALMLTDMHMAGLYLYDGADYMVMVAATGFPDKLIGTRTRLGDGLTGKSAQTRLPVQTQRYGELENNIPYYSGQGVVSALSLPLIWQGRLIGTIGMADKGRIVFDEDDIYKLDLFASLVAAAVDQRITLLDVRAREAEAKALSSRLTHAQEEERLRLAEQLHEAIGYRLVELQKNTEATLAGLKLDHPLAGLLNENLRLLSETQNVTQSLGIDLSSKLLADLGLRSAVRQYIDRLARTTGTKLHLHISGRVKRLPANVERVAYRGVREALINVLRHADANQVNVQVHFGPKMLHMSVRDDGRGFDISRLKENGNESIFGLLELRREVESAGGDLRLDSAPGQGALLEITLPCRTGAMLEKEKTRVLLVDSHEMTRQGLRMLLSQSTEFTCAGEACDGLSAVHNVEIQRPDMVILETELPDIGGIEVAHQVSKRFPHVRTVIFAAVGNETLLYKAHLARVQGYLLKTDDTQTIMAGLKAARNGEISISPSLMEAWNHIQTDPHAGDPLESLTLREREVYQLVLGGNTNRKIGEKLGISFRTVEVHRKSVMKKLGIKSLAQLMRHASRRPA